MSSFEKLAAKRRGSARGTKLSLAYPVDGLHCSSLEVAESWRAFAASHGRTAIIGSPVFVPVRDLTISPA